MSVRWFDYIDEIRPFVPECPDVMIAGFVREIAADFCEDTMVWSETAGFTATPSERNIPFASLITATDVLVAQVRWLGNEAIGEVRPRTQFWLDRNREGWRYENGEPEFYTMPVKGNVLWLSPHTEVNLDLQVVVALKPGPRSVEGPDDLFDDYRVPIQNGTIAALSDVPGKVWSNEKQATKYGILYEGAKGPALARMVRGNTPAPIRVTTNHRF